MGSIGLDLRLTDERCAGAGGGFTSFLAMLNGGKTGACGSRLARIVLTPDAKSECIRRGIAQPGDVTLCVSPLCGRGIADMNNLKGILALLQ